MEQGCIWLCQRGFESPIVGSAQPAILVYFVLHGQHHGGNVSVPMLVFFARASCQGLGMSCDEMPLAWLVSGPAQFPQVLRNGAILQGIP